MSQDANLLTNQELKFLILSFGVLMMMVDMGPIINVSLDSKSLTFDESKTLSVSMARISRGKLCESHVFALRQITNAT